MAAKVVDASALAALLFGEPEATVVASKLVDERLVGPALLPYEIGSVCLKKLRRHPQLREALTSAFAMYDRMSIDIVEVDHLGAVLLADATGLSTYDAAYLWLARELAAELVTLDTRLHAAAATLST